MRAFPVVLITLVACSSSPRAPVAPGEPAAPTAPAHAFSVGGEHACARVRDGSVMCWGLNVEGQIGDGSHEDRFTPVAVPGLADVAGVSAGREHSCAWTTTGEAFCWGSYGSGSVENHRPGPQPVHGLTGVVEMISGQTNACARTRDGHLRCFTYWSWNGDNVEPIDIEGARGATAFTIGHMNACALVAGEVQCWQMPYGPRETYGGVMPVPDLREAVTGLSAGRDTFDHFLAWTAAGRYAAWKYQLGEKPEPLPAPELPAAREVVISYELGCALADEVSCWPIVGGAHGTPYPVPGTKGAVHLDVGSDYPSDGRTLACASFADGHLACWGPASQTGTGARDTTTTAVEVGGIDDAVEVSAQASGSVACARRAGGGVACWGRRTEAWTTGMEGALHPGPFAIDVDDAIDLQVASGGPCVTRRSGTTTCYGESETATLKLPGTIVISSNEACAIDARGATVCETDTPAEGEAAPDGEHKTVPPSVGKVKRLWLGYEEGCALQKSGKLACWWRDEQQGSDTYQQRFVASVAPTAVDVAIGEVASCFVRPDGTVGCAGFAVPFGTVDDVPGITAAIAITTAPGGFCALDRGGTVACWGEQHRRTGEASRNGTFTTLVTIDGLDDAVQIAGHAHAVCALRKSGRVACWGDKDYLGNGGSIRIAPVTVPGITL